MNDLQNDQRKKLGRMLQKMVTQFRLNSGHVRMNVHQGTISFVEINHHVLVPIDPPSLPNSRAGEAEGSTTRDAEIFVRDELQPLVREVLGPYGAVDMTVTAGNVKEFNILRKCRNGE